MPRALSASREAGGSDETWASGAACDGGGRSLELKLGSTAVPSPEADWGERTHEWRYPSGAVGLAVDSDPERG